MYKRQRVFFLKWPFINSNYRCNSTSLTVLSTLNWHCTDSSISRIPFSWLEKGRSMKEEKIFVRLSSFRRYLVKQRTHKLWIIVVSVFLLWRSLFSPPDFFLDLPGVKSSTYYLTSFAKCNCGGCLRSKRITQKTWFGSRKKRIVEILIKKADIMKTDCGGDGRRM